MQPGPSNVGRQPGRHGTARRQTRARQQRATHRARHARAVFSTKLPSPARRAGNSSRHYCRRAGSYRKQVERQATEKRDRIIDRSHRLGRTTGGVSGRGKPRPIILKFVSYQDRSAVFARKKQLKGSKIVLTENLTRRRAELLAKARATAGVKATWTADGRIVCLLEDGRKVSVTDLYITGQETWPHF